MRVSATHHTGRARKQQIYCTSAIPYYEPQQVKITQCRFINLQFQQETIKLAWKSHCEQSSPGLALSR